MTWVRLPDGTQFPLGMAAGQVLMWRLSYDIAQLIESGGRSSWCEVEAIVSTFGIRRKGFSAALSWEGEWPDDIPESFINQHRSRFLMVKFWHWITAASVSADEWFDLEAVA